MQENKTNRLLKWSVLLLVMSNIGILVSLWVKPHLGRHLPPPPPQHLGPTAPLDQALHLTNQQSARFDELRAANQIKIDSIKAVAIDVRKAYFDCLKDTNDNSAKSDSLAKELGALHYAIEAQTFAHFKSIRSLLQDDQKKIFDDMMTDVLRTMPEQPHIQINKAERPDDYNGPGMRPEERERGPHRPPPPPGAPPPPGEEMHRPQ